MCRIFLPSRLSVFVLLSAVFSSSMLFAAQTYREIGWDDLIPEEWQISSMFEGVNISEMSDDDPRVEEVMAKLKELADKAPLEPKIEGERIRIPGYLVPLEMSVDDIHEFLLVPYYGACVHVPPPPLNQTIYVKTADDKPYVGTLFDTVWVEGTITIEKMESDMGSAGYLVDAVNVEKYE